MSDSSDKPPSLLNKLLRPFGIRIDLPSTLSGLLRKLFNSFFYVNGFVAGWFTGYFIFTIIVCGVNIGQNLLSKDISFFNTPNSFFTVAVDSCGASFVELLNIHVFSLILGLIGVYIIWFIHYSMKYHEYPMIL